MRRIVSVIAALFIFQTIAFAQYRTAPAGYYPPSYNGTAFTGRVVTTNDAKDQVTLAYKDGKTGKTEKFTGVFEKGYKIKFKDGTIHDMKPSILPVGSYLTVFYMVKHKKIRGRKLTMDVIFQIMGAPDVRKMYLVYKAF